MRPGCVRLPFHDLRHSLGSLVPHVRPRHDDAARMTKVFEPSVLEAPSRDLER
jgi:hypothetical protein